jgi:hypothetical protein
MRQLGGSMGISATGIFLDWRLAAHGVEGMTSGASPGALAAFAESFLCLAFVCAVSVVAAWFVNESAPSKSRQL